MNLGSGRSAVRVHGSTPVAMAWYVVYLAGLDVLFTGLALAPMRRLLGRPFFALGVLAAATLGGDVQVAEWGI